MAVPTPATFSPDSGPSGLLGSSVPRLWTPPLRDLAEPGASYGPAVVEFAREVLGEPLDPWQEWLVLHLGELRQDGTPRFRQVLIMVARQAGKSWLLRTLALYWLYVERQALVVGMSTNLDYAREAWEKAVEQAEGNDVLASLTPKNGVRRANGEQCLTTTDRCRYKIAASNRKGGRSLSIDRLILDELREHHDWSAWDAAVPATNARPTAQIIAITNQGDDRSVVLDQIRADALAAMDDPSLDPTLGLFEWSAPEGAACDDPEAIAAANPNVGRRMPWGPLLAAARRAARAGGDVEAGYRTESLCQRVRTLDGAIDPAAWDALAADGTLAGARGLVAFLDVSPDEQHVTLVAAGRVGSRIRVEPLEAWEGVAAMADLRRDAPRLLARVRPTVLGWLPSGPAAALAPWLRSGALPCRVEEVKAEVSAVCMGLAEQVRAGDVEHPGDPLLDQHVKGAERLRTGDRWVYRRRGGAHCDAAYAVAGAVFLVRSGTGFGGPEEVIRFIR